MCCGGPQGCSTATVDTLIAEVFGGLEGISDPAARDDFIIERAILTPLNEHVDALNIKVRERFPPPALPPAGGTAGGLPLQRVYWSADSVVQGEQATTYPSEFLNSLNFSGVPPHELRLQVGAPIILLRNMTGGLANGTHMLVTQLHARVIEAKVATGPAKGRTVFVPRLNITPSDVESLPFTLRRCQFPVRPAFAMTINKAQGQTMKMVGVFLPKPVFSHGQLYVALSRVGAAAGVRVLAEGGWRAAGECEGAPEGVYTPNVVYREVFEPAQ